jgi:hypothetical protein
MKHSTNSLGCLQSQVARHHRILRHARSVWDDHGQMLVVDALDHIT